MIKFARHITSLLLLVGVSTATSAEQVEYNLTIDEGLVNFTGKSRSAITVNGGIPGPTLRFKEGDEAVIHVHNNMDVDTSVHWHGVLVPNDQDGVPYVTYPPIAPGTTFTYRFPIIQSGTYWYHSHTGFQEPLGVYGSIVIEPKDSPQDSMRDEVIVLSDWCDERPGEIMHTLKRGSEWYSVKKGTAQSVVGAIQAGQLEKFFERELSRMPPADLSDIAMDRFLINGQTNSVLKADPGEQIRLRLINGSSSTYFLVEFAGGPMTIVAADGVDVEPVEDSRFLIAIAETYDVVVTVPEVGSWEFRATAQDGSGHTAMWIGEGEQHHAPDVPAPDMYARKKGVTFRNMFALTPQASIGMSDRKVEAGMFDQPGMSMSGHGSGDTPMSMPASKNSPKSNTAVDGKDPRRPWPPYNKLRALEPTSFDESKPRQTVRLTLDGNMDRYVWSLNNKTLSEEDTITIRQGKVVRFILINRTMMHHPMHLHGHFFRVLNAQGEHSPLKHTVDIAPMSTTVIEFDADAEGDWFFHCHILYHLDAGMARIVHYKDFDPSPEVLAVRDKLLKDNWYWSFSGSAMSQMTEGNASLANTRSTLNAYWEIGWGLVPDVEYQVDLTYDYTFNQFGGVFAGGELSNTELGNRGIFGVNYTLPLLVQAMAWVDTEGEFRIGLAKDLAVTSRLSLFGDVQYDTALEWEWQAGATFMLNKHFSLIGSYHSDYGAGAGLLLSF